LKNLKRAKKKSNHTTGELNEDEEVPGFMEASLRRCQPPRTCPLAVPLSRHLRRI
jgi:hypothetical protein